MSCVYFIQSGGSDGPIKIGTTRVSAAARLADLQIGSPVPLALLATIAGGHEREAALHARFARLRLRGEWFRPEAELVAFIEGVLAQASGEQAEDLPSDPLDLLSPAQLEELAAEILDRAAFADAERRLREEPPDEQDLPFTHNDPMPPGSEVH